MSEGRFVFFTKDYTTYWMVVKVFVPEGSKAGEAVDVIKFDTYDEMMLWLMENGGDPKPVWVSPEYESRGS